MKIPYLNLLALNNQSQPELYNAAHQVIESGLYLNSPTVYDFEDSWAKYADTSYCVSTANGLDALTAILVAMKALYGWPDNSQVIVSAHTFIASFQAIMRAGLTPVPCDIDNHSYLMCADNITELINPKTVAIMPVHLYGRVCDMSKILEIAQHHRIKVVSDACQAHGMCKGAEMGDAGAFSFYPGKNLGALGDGGCLCTSNKELAEYARAFCNYGAKVKYHHDILGINSRLDAIQAAMLKEKLTLLDKQNTQRQEQALYYQSNIKNSNILLPYKGDSVSVSNWHIYPVLCQQRDKLQQFLEGQGIGTIIHYPIPPHKQRACLFLNNLSLPITEQICSQELSLPLNPTITKEQQQHIVDAINNFKA